MFGLFVVATRSAECDDGVVVVVMVVLMLVAMIAEVNSFAVSFELTR